MVIDGQEKGVLSVFVSQKWSLGRWRVEFGIMIQGLGLFVRDLRIIVLGLRLFMD